MSRVSAFSQLATELELPAAFSHPLGRRIVPVLAPRAQLVAALQADHSRGELPLFPERSPRLQ